LRALTLTKRKVTDTFNLNNSLIASVSKIGLISVGYAVIFTSMMSIYEASLIAISIVGPLVTLASTAWGLTHETSAKDNNGAKRLTAAGQVAVALAFGSALVSTGAIGLNALIKNTQDNAAREANAEAVRSAKKDKFEINLANEERNASNMRWQKFLALSGKQETKRRSIEIVKNQKLLAIFEQRRDDQYARNAQNFIANEQFKARNLVRLESIAVKVTFGCEYKGPKPNRFLNIMSKDFGANLSVSPSKIYRKNKTHDRKFSEIPNKSGEGNQYFSSIHSTKQDITTELSGDGIGGFITQVNFISHFEGDMRQLSEITDWISADVELYMFSDDENLDEGMRQIGLAFERNDSAITNLFYDGIEPGGAMEYALVSPCVVSAELIVNGNNVAKIDALLFKTHNRIGSLSDYFFVKSPVTRVYPYAFPKK
jgi:hypothetical protein